MSILAQQIESVTGYLDDWDNVGFDDRRQVVDGIISRIRATCDEVEIEWKIWRTMRRQKHYRFCALVNCSEVCNINRYESFDFFTDALPPVNPERIARLEK